MLAGVLPRPSRAQERLLFLHQQDPESTAYHLCWAHWLRGTLDIEHLAASVSALVARHESLRTTFPMESGSPRLVVADRGTASLEVVDLSQDATPDVAARELAEDRARHPFVLDQGPLVRFTLGVLGSGDHILVMVVHHVVFDGWSISVLHRELAELYAAARGARPPELGPPPPAFVDLALAERQRVASGALDDSIEHWRRRLSGAPSDPLPIARQRGAQQSSRGRCARRTLPARVVEQLDVIARGERATRFMVLLSTWATLLHRYGGGDDIVIGYPVADRATKGSRSAVGLFVNTIACRCDVSGDPTFRELLRRVRADALVDQPHHSAPFDKVVDALRPVRSASESVLFQHMIVALNVRGLALTLEGIEIEQLDIEMGASQFDLSLEATERAGDVDLALTYACDVYADDAATRLLDHLVRLLDSIAANPDAPISELPMLSFREEQEIRERWNDTACSYGWSDHCLHEPVQAQAEATPDAIAVRCGDTTLTYAELAQRSNALAWTLVDRGARPGTGIAILMERSVAMAVALLAVSKAGAAFVPIEADWPDARRDAVLADADAQMVVVDDRRRLRGHIAPAVVEVPLDVGRTDPPLVAVQPSDIAHIFYTSGSTGTPKGVVVEHRSMMNRLAWAVAGYELTAADRTLVLSPFSFDPFVWQLLCPLMVGGTAVIATDAERSDPAAIVDTIRRQDITITEFVPSVLTLCLEEPDLSTCSSLRTILCGSEAMPAQLPSRLIGALPDCALYNVYGPTETSIDSMWWRCEPTATGASVPIGHPIGNTTVHVVDKGLRLVPLGVPGEICIGGVGVARGYRNRPDETGRVFVPDPFAENPDRWLYRTGDLGVRRADGAVEFLGRMDRQLKINGVRVEPGEIEQALRSHPAVVDAAVLADDTGRAGVTLRAFVSTRHPVGAASLRDHLTAVLPPALIPASFAVADRLPTDQNGKVDRHRIAAVASALSPVEQDRVAPRNDAERQFHRIWVEVLGFEDLGVTDSFFELGGDSILSMQVVALARRAGLVLTASDVVRTPTIEGLARSAATGACAHGVCPAPRPAEPPLARPGRSPAPLIAPLAPAQRWFFEQDFVDADHFNDAVMLRLATATDPGRLVAALQQVVASHSELATCFVGGAACRVQRVQAVPTISVARVDLNGKTDEGASRLREEAAAAAHSSLDISRGRLGAAVLFEQRQGTELMVLFHHLVIDAVSWRTLLSELGQACTLQTNDSLPSARGSTSFGDWTRLMEQLTAAHAFDAELAYWAGQGGSGLALDRITGRTVRESKLLRTMLDPSCTDRLVHCVARDHNVRFDAVLLSALARAVQPWLAGDGLTIELEGHGRDSPGSEALDVLDTIGWFTSLFPVRLTVLPRMSGRQALGTVAEQMAQLPNQGAAFGWLRYAHPDADVRGRLRAIGEPDVAFNYAGQFDHLTRGQGAFRQLAYPPGTLQSGGATRTRSLEVNSFILGGALHVEWTFGPDSEQMARQVAVSAMANLEEVAMNNN